MKDESTATILTENHPTCNEIVIQINESKIPETEKQTVVKSRKGQGLYRTKLLKKYDQKCVVTGVDNPNLLMASHIKPWAICSNNERIDVENGLLLHQDIIVDLRVTQKLHEYLDYHRDMLFVR